MDRINGSEPKPFPDEQHPLPVRPKTNVVIAGWLSDTLHRNVFDEVYALVNGRPTRAVTGFKRPDVAAFFRNPDLERAGFSATVAADRLKEGTQRIDLIGVIMKEHAVAFKFGNGLYVEVR